MNRLRKVREQHFSLGVGMGTGEESEAGSPAGAQRRRPPFPRREPAAQPAFSSLSWVSLALCFSSQRN